PAFLWPWQRSHTGRAPEPHRSVRNDLPSLPRNLNGLPSVIGQVHVNRLVIASHPHMNLSLVAPKHRVTSEHIPRCCDCTLPGRDTVCGVADCEQPFLEYRALNAMGFPVVFDPDACEGFTQGSVKKCKPQLGEPHNGCGR